MAIKVNGDAPVVGNVDEGIGVGVAVTTIPPSKGVIVATGKGVEVAAGDVFVAVGAGDVEVVEGDTRVLVGVFVRVLVLVGVFVRVLVLVGVRVSGGIVVLVGVLLTVGVGGGVNWNAGPFRGIEFIRSGAIVNATMAVARVVRTTAYESARLEECFI